MIKRLWPALITLTFSFALHAQRLPVGISPEHYQLTFTPDLKQATFAGEEIIDLRIARPSQIVTLHASEIKFQTVTIETRGSTEPAKVTLDQDREQANIIAPHMLPLGTARVHIVFTGTLNDQLRGFYLSETAKRRYAVTQFEPTDARRAFPCFDEPDRKATFDITLIVDESDTAISNERLLSDIPGPGEGKHTLKFATTKKLSTYLVAMLVGDFQCMNGSADGIPIRACATPDKQDQGKFALETAEYVMHYYDQYFGIKYPFGKLDLIAIPDFEAGAMENAGAITYRESEMLLDPKIATLDNYQLVAVVVAHEMAHQWFGDLVTMKWWDNLWLNEGFATWMETQPIASWKPEWHEELNEVVAKNKTLDLDSLKNTRPLRQKAETPAQINELFDGIAYGKAAAMLRMVESYVGPELFRKATQNYLRIHSYANATAEDFWTAITRASGKSADNILSSFVIQPGEPLVHVSQDGEELSLSQERFSSDRSLLGTSQQLWTLPVCWRPISAESGSCLLLTGRGDQTKNSSQAAIFANADARGYYRSEYQPVLREQLTNNFATALKPTERISLLGDEWALMRVGRLSISSYLDLAVQLKGERLRQVWTDVLANLAYIDDKLVNESDRDRFRQFVRQLLKPVYQQLATSNAPAEKALRADVFNTLGIVGRDPEVLSEAQKLAEKALQDPSGVDPLFADSALAVAASRGNKSLFDQIAQKFKSTNDQILRHRYMEALNHFESPELVNQALELGISGTIRNQDSTGYIADFVRNPATRGEAWRFIQKRWSDVEKTFTTSSGASLVLSAGAFCDEQDASKVSAFFRVHPVPASERTLRQAVERIHSCADLKKVQASNLQNWLNQHSPQLTVGH